MSIKKDAKTPVTINFHFDPLCPLAWRTALWIREVRNYRPVNVTWRLFSLEVVNRKDGVEPDYVNGNGWAALRTLALAGRQKGNEAVEKLYLSLGSAQHGRHERIQERNVIEASVQEAGLGTNFVEAALSDESTIQDVLNDHEEAVRRYRAFGVPTIALEDSDVGFYGPIIVTVPQGEEAAELWDHTFWALQQPNLFELKRDRGAVRLDPLSAS
jgi:predicted DsbA family dithiol-disulfide isomerase